MSEGAAAQPPSPGALALAAAAKALREAKPPKAAVPERTTADEMAEMLAEARKALGLALERDGIQDTDARHFLVAVAASLAAQETMTRRWAECLSSAVVELRRGISAEDVQAVRDTVAQAAIAAMPTGQERELFVARIIEAVRAGMPAPKEPEKIDLKAVERAAEAGAQRGARLRQEGEGTGRKPGLLAAALAHPAVLLGAGALLGVVLVRLV